MWWGFYDSGFWIKIFKKQAKLLNYKDLKNIKSRLTVFDSVDNWAEHSSYVKFKTRIEKSYDYIKKNTDIIFTVAEDLKNLFDDQPNVYWIPNGVDLKHYQDEWKLVNRDIGDLPKPIIGYIGVIQDRVDLELIQFLAENNPNKSFVLKDNFVYKSL